ncbi:MAG: PAS domain S-box protein [Spirochaetes bacterium]|nr:PAS domain S-box protein [Spirochaetota bacterium]
MPDSEGNRNSPFVKPVASAVQLIAVAGIYFVTARLSLLLALGTTNATPVWPPSGIALAAYLIWGCRAGPAVFVGAFFANILLLSGVGAAPAYYITASLVTAAGNMLEGMVGVYLIRRFTGSVNSFEKIRDLFKFIFFGCLAATTVSATMGVLSFCSITACWAQMPSMWITWWLGDAVGIIITTPFIVMAKKRMRAKLRGRVQIEALAVFIALALSTTVIFWKSHHLEFLVIPILIWIAFRYGRLEAAAAGFIVSAIAVASVIMGYGPLSDFSFNESLLYLQSFIGVVAVVTLCISVLTYERGKSEELRSAVQKELYDIIEFLPDATFAIDGDKKIIAWNKAIETLTGVSKKDMLGQGDNLYAVPFFGDRRPILIDLLDLPSPEIEAQYKYVKRTGDLLLAESFIPRLRGGQGAHLWGIAAPLFDQEGRRNGAIEVIRDVTEQKHVEQALSESEVLHRTLFETANDAILLMNRDRFIDCNARALSMFGCSRSDIVGSSPSAFSPALQPDGRDSREGSLEMINLALAEGPQFFEWEHCRRDGTAFSAEVSLNSMDLHGQILLQAVVRDVTERKRAEEALRRSEATISSVFRAAPVGIFIMKDRVYKSTNQYWCEKFGYPEDTITNENTRMLYESDEEWARVGRELYSGLQANGIITIETRLRRKDGAFRDVIMTAAPMRQDDLSAGTVAIIHDITERKEAERALYESERKYRELVEHANSIILRWSHEGRITFLNEFGQRFFGYSAEEIIGRHVMGTIVPATDSHGQDLRKLMDSICADPVVFEKNVNENMRRDGERVWIAWTNKIAWDEQGRVSEILSVGTDVTELKRAEEAIRALNAGLEQRVAARTAELAVAKEQAEAADRIKSAFLATMSHELRTPLNSIIGFTGIILQGLAGPLNEEQGKQLGMVRSSAQHLLSLINDVLDISKIEAGQLKVHIDHFDVRAVVEKAVAAMRPMADKKGLAFTLSVGSDIGEAVGDMRRVEQVLLNLVGNAVKFTESGEVAVSVEAIQNHGGGAVRFRVADTGIGIRPEDMDDLFLPFRQIDTGITRKSEGTGLGLAICRKLADLMGGEITAESEWGRGSVFTFTLPALGAEGREWEDSSH